jgi:hypothetical protein
MKQHLQNPEAHAAGEAVACDPDVDRHFAAELPHFMAFRFDKTELTAQHLPTMLLLPDGYEPTMLHCLLRIHRKSQVPKVCRIKEEQLLGVEQPHAFTGNRTAEAS